MQRERRQEKEERSRKEERRSSERLFNEIVRYY
jgi:hypothetical protein